MKIGVEHRWSIFIVCLSCIAAVEVRADETAANYKKLSLEELMNIEVNSVSRQESTIGQSPAAIFVISAEMIRRSGATTIPELFRGVPGMDVARIDNNKWAVSVRGFNARFEDKLLVQEVLAYELGYRVQSTDRLSVDFAGFYNVYHNLSVRVPDASNTLDSATGTSFRSVTAQNAMNGETYGLELAATWQPTDWWRLYGVYTFLEMQLHRELTAAKGQEIGREGGSPEQQVYLQSSWNLSGQVEFDLTGRFVDRLSGFNQTAPTASIPDVIDQYISQDARLSWRPGQHLDISIVSQNLLDNHHPESGTSTSIRAPLVELQRNI